MQKTGFFIKIIICSISFKVSSWLFNHAVCKIWLRTLRFSKVHGIPCFYGENWESIPTCKGTFRGVPYQAPADYWNSGEWGRREDKWKGSLSWLVRWARRAGTRDFCSALASLVGPVPTNIFFLTVHYFNSFVPIAQPAGQAAVLGHLSLSECLWTQSFLS